MRTPREVSDIRDLVVTPFLQAIDPFPEPPLGVFNHAQSVAAQVLPALACDCALLFS
jgi:hypothetical protein